jgi:putative redox protein
MSVPISGTYDGTLRTTLHHGPSGTRIATAAPRDNQGDGSSFSPTDLLAAALGSCAVTTMAIVARRDGIPFEGVDFELEKHMRSDPRRVDRVPLRIRMPGGLTPDQRALLERTAVECPVARSLHPDVGTEIAFDYPDGA